MFQCLLSRSSLSFPQQMAPPQDWAPSQPNTDQQLFFLTLSLSLSLFLHLLIFLLHPFPAVFAELALNEPPGARESFQSSHLSIKAPEAALERGQTCPW